MNGFLLRTTLALLLLLSVPAAAAAGGVVTVNSLERAMNEAEKHDLPILLKIGAEWDAASADFDDAAVNNEDIRLALEENVILCVMNAKKEKGKKIVHEYSVKNFPTFILADAHMETIDRWYGFGCQKCFAKRLTSSLEDPVTVVKRLERFRENPTEEDAAKLGGIRHNEGYFAEAAAFYRRALDLNPDTETNYDASIFNSMAYGNYYGVFSAAQVHAQASHVCDSSRCSDLDLMKIASSMTKIAMRANDPSLLDPYLRIAVERTEGSDDKDVVAKRNKLLPTYAVHVLKDGDKAVAYRKAVEKEGWTEDADRLNNFAWWCFQNEINLAEAEKMARKGIKLAEPGKQKANILDTLAEICNLSGDCGDAVDYIRMAVAENPESEYLQNQLVRFEEILAAQR